MKAITLDQPYPALIVAGVKGWETRGNPPAGEMCPAGVRPLPGCAIERGERIAIHASARPSRLWVGRVFATEAEADADVVNALDSAGVDWSEPDDDGYSVPLLDWLPTSAIVCTARVVDALPIIDAHLGWPGDGDTPPGAVLVDDLNAWLEVVTGIRTGDDVSDDITDQIPYGHWTPGGWAWELDEVEALAEPIPCRGRQGVWRLPDDVAEEINR